MKFKNRNLLQAIQISVRKYFFFLLLGIPALTVFLILILVTDSRQKNIPANHTQNLLPFEYPFDKSRWEKGVKIGDITIFLEDLEYRFGVMFNNIPADSSDPENWKKILDETISDAIIQNEGNIRNITKDRSGRINYTEVNNVRPFLEKELSGNISYERITLFFLNSYHQENENSNELPLQERKDLAYSIMSNLRNEVAGGMTMKDAAENLKKTPGVDKIDLAYKTNAYQEVSDAKFNEKIIPGQFSDILWNTEKGTVSPVLTIKDQNNEYAYVFFKINSINKGTDGGGLENFILMKKNQGLTAQL